MFSRRKGCNLGGLGLPVLSAWNFSGGTRCPQKFFQTASKTPYGKRSPPQNLILKIKKQREKIDDLEQKITNEQRISQTKTRNLEHAVKLQHELASIVEKQNVI